MGLTSVPLLFLFILAAAILVFFSIFRNKLKKDRSIARLPGGEAEEYPYRKREPFLTPAERSFFGVLEKAVVDRGRIFAKVRVVDVIETEKGMPKREKTAAQNRIDRKHFDFIVCDNTDLTVLFAVELDDASHKDKNRQKRDRLLEGVCLSADVPLIRFAAKSGYRIDDIEKQIFRHLGQGTNASRKEDIGFAAGERTCPKCHSTLVKRTAKKGRHAGEQFWACSNYPKCKHIEPTVPKERSTWEFRVKSA